MSTDQQTLTTYQPDSQPDPTPAWAPTGEYGPRDCQGCGTPVSRDFRRVFGDNADRVGACLACTSMAAIKQGAATEEAQR